MTILDLLKLLIEKNGSDLHLIAGLKPAIRINGKLLPLAEYNALTPETAQELVFAILNDEQKTSFREDEKTRFELDFAHSVSGLGRFRVNIHKQRGTVAASIRALATEIPKLESLGLPQAIKEFTKAKKGLVLVTGPTGSGKSTTLAAIIDEINATRNDHILTIEDPIEYLHRSQQSYVTQREVGPSADTLSFNNALKYALRQDPDVILIGEMRDYETIGIAITSAETGHLVLGTLHTSSAAQTVGRIIDVFPAEQQPQVRIQLGSNLVGVISQVLLPRADQEGRVVACELMIANAAVKNNVRAGKPESLNQIIQTSAAEGMQSLDQSLVKLCQEGKIEVEYAFPYVHDKATLQTLNRVNSAGGSPAAGRQGNPSYLG
jgi:twitching motility protein PilT